MAENTVTAGERLRVDLDKALAHASRALGQTLEWTEIEMHTIEQAVLAADRGEKVRALLDAELVRAEPRASLVLRLSAEARLCERQAVDLVGSVNPGLGQAQPPRRRRSARHHWHPSQGLA